MRPDTRSFSFTWMKGSQKSSQQQQQENKSKGGQQSATGSSYPIEEQGSSTCSNDTGDKSANPNDSWVVQRGNSGSRLRKLSNSLVRLRAGRYSNLEDENKWQQISEEPLSLEEDEDEDDENDEEVMMMDVVQPEPDIVVTATAHLNKPVMKTLPFQPLENNNATDNEGAMATGENSGMSLSKRLNKTVQGVKASLGNFSQRFRKSTRRRYRMPSSGNLTPGSVASPAARKILGRTPTKLYSPFGIETPITVKTPKRLADRPSTPRLTRKSMVASLVYSPSNNFRRDLDEARRGMRDFQILSRDITRRSVRF